MAHLLFKGGPFFVIMKLIKTRGDNMALIKQVAEVKPKLQKKVITIKQSTWKEAENYIKPKAQPTQKTAVEISKEPTPKAQNDKKWAK